MSKKHLSLLVLVALMMTMLLSACGGATSTSVPAVATTAAAPAATTAAAPKATTAGAAPAATTAGAAPAGANPACEKPNTPATGPEIKVGAMMPLTGGAAGLGIAMQRGYTIALKEINNCGGINGRKLVMVERDDQAKPDVGTTNVRELIDNKEIVGLIGTANTAVGVVQAPIVNQSKMPWIITVSTGTALTRDTGSVPSYIFRVSMVDSEQTPFVADYILSKYKKIALISDETSYGQLGSKDLKAVLDTKGTKPILDEVYKIGWTSDDFKPLVTKIKQSAPDVLVSWGLGAENANLRKAMKDLSLDTPLVGSWGLSMPNYQQLSQGLEAGTIVPQTISVDTTNARQQKFFDDIRKDFNTEQIGFPSGAAQSYDGMWMMALALKQPGTIDSRDKLREAIYNTASYDGLIKKYEKPFQNQYQEAFTKADFFFTIWKDGKIVRLDTK